MLFYHKYALFFLASLTFCSCLVVSPFRQYPGGGWNNYPPARPYPPPPHYVPGCPVCDSSVFSYCSHKLEHDSCCCGDGYYTGNSFECQYTDCSYLHANSCKESELIITCCCDGPYKAYSKPHFFTGYVKK